MMSLIFGQEADGIEDICRAMFARQANIGFGLSGGS